MNTRYLLPCLASFFVGITACNGGVDTQAGSALPTTSIVEANSSVTGLSTSGPVSPDGPLITAKGSSTSADTETPSPIAPSSVGETPVSETSKVKQRIPQTAATATQRPAEPRPDPADGPLGQSGEWSLKFSDEFEGSTIDESRWEKGWFANSGFSGPINTLEQGCYHPSQASQAGGLLKLSLKDNSDSSCTTKSGARASYVSGIVTSRKSFSFSYGYSEARVKLPTDGNGSAYNWPAFWTTGQNWPNTGEIDIMEILDGSVNSVYHWGTPSNHKQKKAATKSGWITSGYHTYGAKWQPGKIEFYYDGELVGTINEGVTGDPHYVILNYGVNGKVKSPATMEVDYVRVWQTS